MGEKDILNSSQIDIFPLFQVAKMESRYIRQIQLSEIGVEGQEKQIRF